MGLTIDQIRTRVGPPTKQVTIENFGGDVTVRKLTAAEYIALQSIAPPGSDKEATFEYFIEICKAGSINDDGSPLFGDEDAWILKTNPLDAMKLGQEICAFNNLFRSDGPEKNSNGQPPESSGTG